MIIPNPQNIVPFMKTHSLVWGFNDVTRSSGIRFRLPQMAKFMGPTWCPPGSFRPQVGPMLAHEPYYHPGMYMTSSQVQRVASVGEWCIVGQQKQYMFAVAQFLLWLRKLLDTVRRRYIYKVFSFLVVQPFTENWTRWIVLKYMKWWGW